MKKPLENKANGEKPKKGKTLKEKMQRHLTDQDDIITEEDMREVIVGVDAVNLSEPDEPAFQAEDIPHKKTINPWDVIDEDEGR